MKRTDTSSLIKILSEVVNEEFNDDGWMQSVNVREKSNVEPSNMQTELTRAIDEIVNRILNENLLTEDPSTVWDTDNKVVISCDSSEGAIAFFLLIDRDLNKKKWFINDKRNEGPAWHSGVRVNPTPDFPNVNWSRYEVRGRLWPRLKICSFYGNQQSLESHFENIEELFDILGLNIEHYKFDFGGSSSEEGFKPWPGAKKVKSPEIEMSPEIRRELDRLIPMIHTTVGDDRKKIEKQIEDLYKKAGVESSRAKELAAYIDASAEKLEPYSKGGGGSVAGYRGRLPAIAEDKVQIYSKTLCPKVWDENKQLDPEVRNALLKIAFDFYTDSDIRIPIQDVYLLGSVANYNWTPASDMDVHILVDSSVLSMHPENVEKFFRSLVGKWNIEHDVKVKGHPVELYLQDVRDKNAATGVYSLVQNLWVKEPSPENISVDKNAIQKKYSMWVQRINDAVKNEDEKKLKRILEQLRDCRQAGLDKNGEFSTENLVFKILRSRGFLDKLKDGYNQIYDKKMTVKDGFEPTSQGPNPEAGQTEDNNGEFYQRTNARMRQLEESQENQTVKSKYFTAIFGTPHVTEGAYVVMLGSDKPPTSLSDPKWFVNAVRFGGGDNWFVNAHSGAFKMGYKSPSHTFKTIEELLAHLDEWYEENSQMDEVRMKDLKSQHPQFAVNNLAPKMKKLTLDNLKALRDKAKRFFDAAQAANNQNEMDKAVESYLIFNDEIKKRLAYINKPVGESAKQTNKLRLVPGGNQLSKGAFKIMLGDEWIANTYKINDDMFGNNNGKWVFNRAQGAFNRGIPSVELFFNTPEELIQSLESKFSDKLMEGYGAGIPETDRLKIKNGDGSTRRWQIRSKDAPKTPLMTKEVMDMINEILDRTFLLESPNQKTLKKNKKPLTDEERAEVMKAGAVWHHGPNGEETPAVWKSVVNGKTWYACNTHRAIQIKPTLKGAIKAFKFIKTTS